MLNNYYIMQKVASLLVFIIALSFREFAYAYVAYKCGDDTAMLQGRMTLNPLKHIDPMGMILLLVFGFGWARPVMINPTNYKHPKRDHILVSLAGIITNFIMGSIFICIYHLVVKSAITSGHELNPAVQTFLFYCGATNISLAVFNLIPIPPSDGYQALKGLLLGKVDPSRFWNIERRGMMPLIVFVLLNRVLEFFTGFDLISFLINGAFVGISNFFVSIIY